MLTFAYNAFHQTEEFIIHPGRGCSAYADQFLMISWKERWILISAQSFSAAGLILQLWFNTNNPALNGNHVGHFAGSFKIVAKISFAILILDQMVERFQWIGGYSSRTQPISMQLIEKLLLAAVTFWQAIRYPGIPQLYVEEGEEVHEMQ